MVQLDTKSSFRAMARSNPQGLDNHRPWRENDAAGVSATQHSPPRCGERSRAVNERRYNMPPESSLSLSNMTLSAFYYRFCDANPEAHRTDPWDVIFTAYEKYISQHYGKNLDHVWAAYKSVCRHNLCVTVMLIAFIDEPQNTP